MKVTSNYKTPLRLHTGVLLEPNTPTTVSNWDEVSKNKVIKAWLKAGVLSVDSVDAKIEEKAEPGEPESPVAEEAAAPKKTKRSKKSK